jgi:carbon-monoxide dehydrogenase large subunit
MASMAGAIAGSIQGPYLLTGYSYEATVAATNKTQYVAYRGPWEMETWARERLYDVIAHELGLDPADVRRKTMSLGAADDVMFSGASLAEVASRASLELALDTIGYDALRAEQAVARAEGRLIGIGFATFIESAPGPANRRAGAEQARAKLEMDGHLTVYTPQSPHGQSHETTLAQVAADEMGIPMEHVRVVHGDSALVPYSMVGTGGSRAATWATGSVMHATRSVKEKVFAIASGMLEIGVDDLEIVDGAVEPKGVPDKAIPLAQIATLATTSPGTLPPGIDGLEATVNYTGAGIGGSGWSGGTHACVIEVDPETGRVTFLRYVVAEDCGQVINPAIVEGQVRGGVAQGIGGVLYELSAYDEQGQFLAGTFMDYLVPTAVEIPEIEVLHMETRPQGEVDFRGVGEGGAIVAPAALSNAIEDALAPFGARVTQQHLPPTRILELMGVIDA